MKRALTKARRDVETTTIVETGAIVPAPATAPVAVAARYTEQDLAEVKELLDASAAERTRAAYEEDLVHFRRWCEEHGATALPAAPATVILYIKDLARGSAPQSEQASRRARGPGGAWSVATIERRRTSIAQAHRLARFPDPCDSDDVRRIMRGIRRHLGVRQRVASPLLPEHIQAALARLPEPRSVLDLRDVAVVTLGFPAATRRLELSDVDLADVRFVPDGIELYLGPTAARPERRTKTDQEGQGVTLGILAERGPADPVAALRAWLAVRGKEPGPLFYGVTRQGKIRRKRMPAQRVSLIVKRFAELAGLPEGNWSGHSLRAGFVTAAHRAGFDLDTIMKQTRHRRAETARKYLRDADRFRKNAGRGLLSAPPAVDTPPKTS